MAQKSLESPPSQSYKTGSAHGDLKGHWKYLPARLVVTVCWRTQQNGHSMLSITDPTNTVLTQKDGT
eukprot:1150374-Pelagomonas_calceolata.AAC.6